MNDKTYNLVIKILDADITREARTEIIKFFLLPRNTSVRPQIEQEPMESSVGTIQRPSSKDLDKIKNPKKYEGDEAMKNTLDGIINSNEQTEMEK
jgi:hypothetical protein